MSQPENLFLLLSALTLHTHTHTHKHTHMTAMFDLSYVIFINMKSPWSYRKLCSIFFALCFSLDIYFFCSNDSLYTSTRIIPWYFFLYILTIRFQLGALMKELEITFSFLCALHHPILVVSVIFLNVCSCVPK